MVWTMILLLACLGGADQADALTIYRIGGEDQPRPTRADEDGIDFVQLMWQDLDEDRFGSSHQLELTTFAEPVRLDSSVNLTPLLRDRGGVIKLNNGYAFQNLPALDLIFDEDDDTAFSGLQGDQSGSTFLKSMWISLGGLFPISRIVIRPTTDHYHDRFIPEFTLGTNDGDKQKDGLREARYNYREAFVDYDIQYQSKENTEPVLDLRLRDEPIENLFFFAPSANWEIAEMEIYGHGFASRANYTSNIIPLDGRSSLGDLVWAGRQDSGAVIELSTRSGGDADPNLYWRNTFRGAERTRLDHDGKPLTRSSYRKLEGGERAGIVPDHENWEFWTPPLTFDTFRSDLAGTEPRQFLQFRADFSSTRSGAGARIEYLQFEVSHPPAASRVLAEIVPTTAPIAELTPFTYKITPTISGDDLGFDSIEIQTSIAPVSVDAVRIGHRSLSAGDYEVREYNGESFVVKIPHIDVQQSGELIEVDFQSEVFKVGTVFAGRVFDSSRPHEVRQRVTEGDADVLADGNTLSVNPTQVSQDAIRALRVSAFTPNGDGINDLLEIEYDLVNLSGHVPVTVGVYDLAGSQVAQIAAGSGGSGRFTATWDGRGESDQLLPPGIYLLSVEVEADTGTYTAVSSVPLVY